MASLLQLYLLSRDRPEYLRETLRSALNQAGDDIEVIVSDNSERNDVARMLAEEFPEVRCIRRTPPLGAFDHFRTIIDEASAELVVMFHDDDVLLDGYVEVLRGALEADPALAAVCCNAAILRGSQITDELFAPAAGDVRLCGAADLLHHYFALSIKGPAPFPGYMYRRSAIQGLCLDPRHGGKYSDVSFLLKVLQRGPILWLQKPLMRYRFHGNNDSATEAVGQRLRLLRYVYTTTSVTRRSPLIRQYRYRYWMSWWRGASAAGARQPWRRRVVRRFLVACTAGYALTRATLWQRSLAKLGRLARQLLPRAA